MVGAPGRLAPQVAHERLNAGCKAGLGPADRIAARYDLADQDSHRPVGFALGIDGVLVRGSCVPEHTEDIAFGQYLVVVQGKKQRLADCKRGHSRIVVLVVHVGSLPEWVDLAAQGCAFDQRLHHSHNPAQEELIESSFR